jgi:hypothetical protein
MPSIALHSAGTDMILFEGNDCTGIVADYIHGTHNLITMSSATSSPDGTQGHGQADGAGPAYTFSRYFNFIGNVLGKPGFHTRYEDLPPDGTDGDHSIYTLGWSGNEGRRLGAEERPPHGGHRDALGQFDTVTNRARWEASEVPSGLSGWPTPSQRPPTGCRPPSTFRPSPAWWGPMPWPAIGPDVSTAGRIPPGMSTPIRRRSATQLCGQDPAYPEDISGLRILVFNAGKHYPGRRFAVRPAAH